MCVGAFNRALQGGDEMVSEVNIYYVNVILTVVLTLNVAMSLCIDLTFYAHFLQFFCFFVLEAAEYLLQLINYL